MTETATQAAPPLSVAQEALWYFSRLNPKRIAYNEAISIRKDGPLDALALRRALHAIVARHEAWRTTFDIADGSPAQIVRAPPTFDLPVIDLSHLNAEQAERQAVRVVAEVARVPYDVRHLPLVRPRLFRFPGEHHRLYLSMHHLVFDGVSVTRVVLPELIAFYDAFCSGAPEPLLDPPARYADYARWEQEWIAGPRAARRLAHWRDRLDPPPVLALPRDHPRPPEPRLGGGAIALAIPAATVDRLRATGERVGATLFQVLASTWALLLGRYSGQREAVFATAADLRQRPEFQRVVGCCLTTLVLRVDLSGDPSVAELLVRLRNELFDELDQLVPFERIVRELHPDHDSNTNPVYQTMLIMEPAIAVANPEWSLHQIDSVLADAVGAAKLDLELQLDERSDGHIAAQLIYDRDLFDRATAVRMADHWLRLVDGVLSDPAAPISTLAILTPAEEHRQLVEWNATATERPRTTVRELIRVRAAVQPDATAVSIDGESISYAELEEPADTVVHRLLAAEAQREDHAPIVNLVAAMAEALGLGPDDSVLVLPATISSDPAISLWLPLVAGARIVLAPEEIAGDGAAISRLIRAEHVTFMHARPSTWQALIDGGLRPARALRALSGGEPLSRELADAILERCRVVWNAYGTAQTSGYRTLARVEADAPITIGRPISNTSLRVVDGHGSPVPVGVTGELVVGGDGPDCLTGDRARWLSDGRVQLV